MKNVFTFLAAATMITACVACGKDQDIQIEPEKPKEPEKIVFAEGADISWVTQMEKDGMKFHNASGNETECTALMKEIGFDAIRLRVWVDPEDGWCGKDDVLEKARRAQALGLRLMKHGKNMTSRRWPMPSRTTRMTFSNHSRTMG